MSEASDKHLREHYQEGSVHDAHLLDSLFLYHTSGNVLDIGNPVKEGSQNDADKHLRNLSHRDPFGVEPSRLGPNRHEKVVKVHDSVHSVIHGGNEDAHGRKFVVAVPQKVEDRSVVEPVKENELLFVNNDEECIQKLASEENERLVTRKRIHSIHSHVSTYGSFESAKSCPQNPLLPLAPVLNGSMQRYSRHE